MTAEEYRTQLRKGTPDAVRRVRWVVQTTTDPRVQHDAREYLSRHKTA